MILSTQTDNIFRRFGEDEGIKIFARAGYDAIDLSMFQMTHDDCPLNTIDPDKYGSELKKKAESAGIVFNQAHAPFPCWRSDDKDYSAKKLAEDLGTNTRYISAVVNVRFHMNYTSFVNKFRIEEAMTLLVDKRYRDLNMEDISDMVGFANRQSFYASFYKLNGITPREYKLRHYTQHPQEAKRPLKRNKKKSNKE